MKSFKEMFMHASDHLNIHQQIHRQAVEDHLRMQDEINKNEYSKLLVRSVLGAAIGGGVGYLISKKLKKNKTKTDRQTNKQIILKNMENFK